MIHEDVETRGASVVVVVDWARCHRAAYWKDDLLGLTSTVIEVPLADSLYRENPQSLSPVSLLEELDNLERLKKRRALILNFDCINGDPSFGSSIALDWFGYRYPEVLSWVYNGGILIVEGQTMLSVPTQDSYDALFGHKELRVSGPSVKPIPRVERNRTGGECRITPEAGKYRLFDGLHRIRCTPGRKRHDLFPGDAGLMLSDRGSYNWSLLYRGWFSRVPTFHRQFNWVPLIKTDRSGFDHPVLMGARHGNGAMFVSTMFLAGTGQRELINGLIQWNAHDNPFPTEEPFYRKILRVLHEIAKPAMSIAAGVLTSDVLRETGFLRFVSHTGMSIFFAGIYWLVIWAAPRAWRTACDFLGL